MTLLTIPQVASYALDWFKKPDVATTMTAIAMAESAGDTRAAGDPAINFGGIYDRYACDGYLSFGLWQIFLGVHHGRILNIANVGAACSQADWLKDPNNNARAAAAVFADQGYQAWSTWKIGAHNQYMALAWEAVNQLIRDQLPEKPPMPPIPNDRDDRASDCPAIWKDWGRGDGDRDLVVTWGRGRTGGWEATEGAGRHDEIIQSAGVA